MSKYVIKNCPNYDDYFNPNETCRKKYSQYCQDCTDCILKQIVNECANSLRFSCERILAENLLGLLDIQEIE